MGREFDLIAKYFTRPVPAGYVGVGDDCALMPLTPGKQLAVSVDLLVEGRHFFSDTNPHCLGHKALAVNLSDLAASGARPLGCVLGLSLPTINEDWLTAFSTGFFALADQAACPLVGGDTTGGVSAITLSVTVFGEVDPAKTLHRAAGQINDDIWVTGQLGGAHTALRLLQGQWPQDSTLLAATRADLERPLPPLQFAQGLGALAHAALDISDGFAQDLGHILTASRCGAVVHYPQLPVHPALCSLPPLLQQEAVLGGGDVYQLCFTASPASRQALAHLATQHGILLTRVGQLVAQPGLVVLDQNGQPMNPALRGYEHF